MWPVPDTQLAKDFRCQSGFENYTSEQKATTMLIKGPVPAKKKELHFLNYTTGGPYGRARLQDRWTECHNKKLSTASQLGSGRTNAGRWSVKSDITQDAQTRI